MKLKIEPRTILVKIEINNPNPEKAKEELVKYLKAFDITVLEITDVKQAKTEKQFKAVHLWLSQWAELFNEHGIDMRLVVGKQFQITPTTELLKEYVWKKIQFAMFGIKSTTKLKRHMLNPIIDIITKEFGQRYGLYVPFPFEQERENQAINKL